METMQTSDDAVEPLSISGTLEKLCSDVRATTRAPADWQALAEAVAAQVRARLPSGDEVRRAVPAAARDGADRSQVLHVEPDGSFSVLAMISRPGQVTSIHDHITWGVVAVIAGIEDEERFELAEGGRALILSGTRRDLAGTVTGFAPPEDIHRITNPGPEVAISLHVYGTDINRIPSSLRKTYDLPVVEPALRHLPPTEATGPSH